MTETTSTLDWIAVKTGTPLSPETGGIRSPAALLLALDQELRASFPVNSVPAPLVSLLADVKVETSRLTYSLHRFVDAMIQATGQTPKPVVYVHHGFGPRDSIKGSMCGADGVLTKEINDVTCPECRKVMFDTSHRG